MGVVREDVVKMSYDVDYKELTKLKEELDAVKKACTGDVGDDAFDELVKESKKANEGLKDTKKQAAGAHDNLKKIASTGFEKTISGLKSMASTLGKVAVSAGKVLAKGLGLAAAGVGAVVGKSVMNFADYEQLIGGVDTLFKGSSGTVQKYADNAYKTAGLSANAYMETVTSFSASLIQSLGGDTAKAAEYANVAITDMSDNANKMGTDMGSIQDAYQGFAKQNYTMLDNLKLGYGGTKTEMQRLLKDAQKISGVKYDLSSYADVVQAIHVIQENMGIAGTTSKEASETISGSFASMKSAWDNTLTSLVVGGDSFDRCVENLVDSAKTFGKNIMPAITKALEGVGSLIEELAPIIEKELPGIIDSLLPPLIQAATSLIKGLIVALPDIISTLAKELPGVLQQVWEGMNEAFGDIPGMAKVEAFFGKLVEFCEKNTGVIKKIIGTILGLVAAFKLFNTFKGLSGLFGGGGAGGSGGGLMGMFSGLANLKPQTALKGILNLAIILGGLAILGAALMAVAPYMAKLSDLQSIGEVLLVIAAVGFIGKAMADLAGKVGNIPVATVAKGLANIAIALVGFGALAAVLMFVSPYMAQLSDMGTMMELLIVIGVVGLVGSALAGLAGLIGAIPIALVTSGLANIALALGGFTAVVAAFGALSKIDGFNEFITSGGETLTNLCNILGQMVGSIIGGIGEGITDSLPTIGANLSSFATSIQPMFDTFSGVDTEGLKNFATAFAAFIAVIAGEKIVSLITGGIDYATLGTNLTSFATNVSGFFSTISTFDEGAFTKATSLFNCLANISSLPKEGGIVGWFQGEVDYASMATGLNQLAGTVGFFTAVSAIPEAAFTAATNLFNCLAGVSALPKDGGIAQWFTGTVDFAGIASGLQTLSSATMISALNAIAAIPAAAFTGLTSLFDALAGIKAVPSEGGIFGWFTGSSTEGLTAVASALPDVATDIASFFTNIGGRTDFSPITNLFDALSSIEVNSEVAEGGFFGGMSDLATVGQGLGDFATNAASFFTAINTLNTGNMSTFFATLKTAGELPTTVSTLSAQLGLMLSNLITTVTTKLTELQANFQSQFQAILAAINAMIPMFYQSGVDIMQGLNDGINSMKDTVLATIADMADAISSELDSIMVIKSPSHLMFGKGEYIGEGLALGMESKIPALKVAASDMAYASIPSIPYASSYTPDSGVSSTTYNNGGNSEYMTVSPTFNFNISGSQDDRTLTRKVKQYVTEAFTEICESMERKMAY